MPEPLTAMPRFETKRHVPYGPEAMLELVADVTRYPEFVPLCESLKVMSRKANPDGTEELIARMGVGYGLVKEMFTSRVTIDRRQCEIRVAYVDGPFRSMDNIWRFKAARGGCDVEFKIAYEFRSMALQLLLGSMFDHVFRKFAEAFEGRARRVYGVAPKPAPAEIPAPPLAGGLRGTT